MTRSITRTSLTLALWLLAGLTVAPTQAAKLVFYHLDALGSPVAATDEVGSLLWREDYTPYGERLLNDPAAANDSRWYTGHVHDRDTGLTYMGARYYDPTIGRFMGMDPVGFQESAIHSFNRYAYVNNNPYAYIDPDGGNPFFVVDWYDFAVDVGDLLVNEIIYTSATILGNEGVKQVALEEIVESRIDATLSTTGLVSPVPGTGRALKAVKRSRAAIERAKNIKKGIPESILGPSGRPKIHKESHPTLKRARDAAAQEGDGPPVKHVKPKRGKSHFHATDDAGEKIKGGTHHEFPERFL